MKKLLTFSCLLTTAMFVLSQSMPDYDIIAERIVKHSLEVQPGEVVIISGTPAEMDLLGALVVAVSKAGGQPTVEVSIPEAIKRSIVETPIKYMSLTPTYSLMQVRIADCFINTGSNQDPTLFSDVPEEKIAAYRKAYHPISDAIDRAKYRGVSLGQTGGIPSQAYAESIGANYEDMLAMFWKAVGSDHEKMSTTGKELSKKLKPGSEVNVTSEEGTNLSFKIADVPVRLNCGSCFENKTSSGPSLAFLPAGEVYTCIDPASASGIVVVPVMSFRGNELTNLRMTFKDGRLSALTADKNAEIIKEALKMSTGDKDVLSILDLGINPDSHPLDNSNYYSWEMAGMITLSVGDNSWAGGDVDSDIGLSFHLADANLSIDGTTLVEKGELQLDQIMAEK